MVIKITQNPLLRSNVLMSSVLREEKFSFSERLKAERIRLGMNQDNFAAIGGVTRRTQSQYETGNRFPDTNYLAALAAVGVDINFIVTGTKVLSNNLNKEEKKLLEYYRAATSAQQVALLEIGRAFAAMK